MAEHDGLARNIQSHQPVVTSAISGGAARAGMTADAVSASAKGRILRAIAFTHQPFFDLVNQNGGDVMGLKHVLAASLLMTPAIAWAQSPDALKADPVGCP
jgi:hypothetical protein